ncbi:sulfur carrier protein ThiS [Enterobacteriaceae bacterium 4M9]|nr:sulfur carrier protein ThiS [Enterobacteriaceae bacterium 4M9]
MQILLNDVPHTCKPGETVQQLLIRLKLDCPGSALALNQTILPREQWEHHTVQDGDALLLFQAIAGG